MKLKPTIILSSIFFLFSAVAYAQTTGIIINEILASNVATNKSPVYSEYADWIELANTTTTSIDLSGYYLSDDLKNKTKWKIPSNTIIPASGYMIFWADDRNTGLHTNFKLSRDGESVGLFNSSGVMVDTITFGYQYDDVSYGRYSNDNSKWGYFRPPTPSAKNVSSGEIAIAPVPVFSIPGGYYKNGQILTLSSPNSNAEIRYTLNGTEPTKSSLLYTVPFKIDSTISIRARTYEIGKTQSLVVTNTYLINEQNNLPVVSIVTDPANLFDDKIGIYVTGTNGIRGSCDATIRNLNQDWERPVNIELFEPSGERVINQGAGIKIFGGCSRTRYPQKSFALFARSEYGKGSFEYKLFPDKQIAKFESFILRSSSDDQVYTMFRDALAHSVMKDRMDAETQAYRPAVVFINGVYWGIHNIREKVNENYLAGNFGVNPDDVNILESNAGVVYGTNAGYTNMVNFAANYNMAVQSNYEYMKSWMDIDQYLDYQIGHIYLAERDWPGNNIKYWRANSGTYSRWRWINFDLDQTFTFIWITENMIEKTTTATGSGWPNPEWSTRLFRNLLKNENFKNDFIQRYAYHANTTFKPERLIHFIDSLSANIAPEIPRHIKRWGGKIDPDSHEGWTPKAIFKTYQEWLGNVDTMRIFSLRRPQYSTAHILQKFGLSGVSKIDVKMNSSGKGILKVVDRQIPNNFSGTFYNDIPLRLSAVPMYGSKFSYWEVEGTTNQVSSLIPAGSLWKYYDKGVDLKTSWYQSGFDDSKWASGNAQLGYGDGDETTVIGYGPNSSSRYITTYFRKAFSITDKSTIASLSFEILADDGAVVYLNGSEVQRINIPSGIVQYSTLANGAVADENGYTKFSASPSLLQNGINTIAVEVHQASASSSDLGFDLKLIATSTNSSGTQKYNTSDISIVLKGDSKLTAYFEADPGAKSIPIVINEINYKAASDFDTEDWVEIYNSGNTAIDLSGWYFHDTDEAAKQILPNNTIIGANDYLVLCKDTAMFAAKFPKVKKRVGNFQFGLSSSSEKIFLKTQLGEIVDEVNFSSSAPWPVNANGTGRTIELTNAVLDNNKGESWTGSKNLYGTPGMVNSTLTDIKKVIEEIPASYFLSQNYPNPFNPSTIISYRISAASRISLKVYDVLGREVADLINEYKLPGDYSLVFNTHNYGLSSGVYFYTLRAGEFVSSRKMVLIK